MSLFRQSLIRCAPAISKTPLTNLPATNNATVQSAAEQLLPPLQLYRRLLRVHRKVLPIELKVMGDEYVKAEFRRTRTTDNPLHIVGFLSEWKKYLDFHEQMEVEQKNAATATTGSSGDESSPSPSPPGTKEAIKWGKKLDPELFERLSADQLGQLYELMEATKDVYATPEEIAARGGGGSGDGNSATSPEGIPLGQVLPDLAKK